MERLILELEQALKNQFYFLSLNSALVIPDICSALESSDGKTSGQKYKKWFETYCGKEYDSYLIGDDIYKIRCASLHQGKLNHDNSNFEKIIFQVPDNRNNTAHLVKINNSLIISLEIFIKDIIDGYNIWYAKVKNDPQYIKNLENSFKVANQGLNHMRGFSIII
jgi:hypothetical protein